MKILFSILVLILIYSCSQNESDTETSLTQEMQTENTVNNKKSKAVPVEAYKVKIGKIEEKLPFTAILKPSHSVDIISESTGKIIKINKDLGSKVGRNEILAEVDGIIAKSNFEQAKAQVLTAENNLKIAELNLTSDKQLFENGDISKLEYDNSELAVKSAEANHLAALANQKFMQKQYQDTRIISPINGVVARKYVELGSMVNPSMPVYRVVDLSELKLEIGVPQSFISNIEVGDEAEVIISAIQNNSVSGIVKFISPQADENTGAFLTEVHVKNSSDQSIRAGMTAKVNLILKTKQKQLILPNYAIITKNDEHNVYKIEKDMAKLVPVSTGELYGSKYTIEDGIQDGDTVVVVGMKNLGLETKVIIETLHNQ